MRVVTLINEENGRVIGERIACAETFLTRLVGLLGRRSLAPGEGLWIRPSSGVHTLGMRFPIDVVGLDRTSKVVRLWENLAAFRVTSIHRDVASVLELAAGEIRSHDLCIGNRIAVVERETRKPETGVTRPRRSPRPVRLESKQ